MSLALTIGRLHVVAAGPIQVEEDCSCEEAQKACTPAFVFSVPGQVRFRTALHHLTTCRKRDCRSLRARVFSGMEEKLKWLFRQNCLLGCVHVQPLLYGQRKVLLQRRDFPQAARHLACCPKDSCAQLRRALMLNVRERVRRGLREDFLY